MKGKADSIATVICFIAVISLISLDNFLYGGERTVNPAGKPAFSVMSLLRGDYLEKLEDNYNKTFIAGNIRDKIKTAFATRVLGIGDLNGFYLSGGRIVKMEYRLNEASVKNAAEKLNEIHEKYLRGHEVYYCIIPDKNLAAAPIAGRPAFDYKRMIEIMENTISASYKRIDIEGLLEPGDYYNTDPHWRQEKVIDVCDRLLAEMKNTARASGSTYKENVIYPFYGSHFSQAWIGLEPDTLIYLTNEVIENASVSGYEIAYNSPVYNLKELNENLYDVFLYGSKPLITVERNENGPAKELILFRDSFASSIAPLLLAGYSKITLVDLRYMTTELLGEYIDFGRGQDVCFLYSTLVVNNSYMLK